MITKLSLKANLIILGLIILLALLALIFGFVGDRDNYTKTSHNNHSASSK